MDDESELALRWLWGDELRVRGSVVDVVIMEEGEAERIELRVGLKAVLRRRREPDVLRRGVKDWKRLVRVDEGILVVEMTKVQSLSGTVGIDRSNCRRQCKADSKGVAVM